MPAKPLQGTTRVRSSRTIALTAVLLLAMSSCTSVLDFFSSEVAEKPAELQDFARQVELQERWSVDVGNGQGKRYNSLTPAVDGAWIYAASADGTVVAVDKANGDIRWRVETDEQVTGGVGASNGMVLFGTRDAQVVALDQISGREVWKADVSSEVLSTPQTNGQVVVAQTVDGKLVALEAVTGEQRWIYESTVPPLSLRGSGAPLLTDNIVVAGFSNGMIAAIDTTNGFLLWEERVAVPQGRYDIERVIDVDGDLLLAGSTVFAASYQGNLMGFDLQTGRIVWGMEGSTYHGLGEGLGHIYYVTDESHILAIRSNTDQIAWENDDLRLRRITAPRTFSNFVVVADFEGYVHLLSQIDGSFVGRYRADGDAIRANVVSDNNALYVYSNSGKLMALTLR